MPWLGLVISNKSIHNDAVPLKAFNRTDVRGTATAATTLCHKVDKFQVPVVSPVPVPLKTETQ